MLKMWTDYSMLSKTNVHHFAGNNVSPPIFKSLAQSSDIHQSVTQVQKWLESLRISKAMKSGHDS